MIDLLCECVSHDDRVSFLASLLDARPHLNVTSNMLIRMANAADQVRRTGRSRIWAIFT